MVWFIKVSILTGREDDEMMYCNMDLKMSPKGFFSRLWYHWVPLRGRAHWGTCLEGQTGNPALPVSLPFLGTMLQTGRLLYHVLPRCAAWSQALGHQDQVTLDYEIK